MSCQFLCCLAVGTAQDLDVGVFAFGAEAAAERFHRRLLRRPASRVEFGGMLALYLGLAVMKFIPGLNFLAGCAQAPALGVANYICGIVYYKVLGEIVQKEKYGQLDSTSDIDSILKQSRYLRKDSLTEIKAQGTAAMQSVDYKNGKKEAQEIVNGIKNTH